MFSIFSIIAVVSWILFSTKPKFKPFGYYSEIRVNEILNRQKRIRINFGGSLIQTEIVCPICGVRHDYIPIIDNTGKSADKRVPIYVACNRCQGVYYGSTLYLGRGVNNNHNVLEVA